MRLPLFIAGRYLFAKKSHNVINIISAISALGMAIGTAALIIILSVYNGFDKIVGDSIDGGTSDFLLLPKSGKILSEDIIGPLKETEGISGAEGYLEENVFYSYSGSEGVAKSRGVNDPTLYHGEVSLCAVSSSLSENTGINPRFVSPLILYYPSADAKFSPTASESMLRKVKVFPKKIFQSNSGNEGLIIPLDRMRELTGIEKGYSAIEINVDKSLDRKQLRRLREAIDEMLELENVRILDRYAQNEALFKMMKYEKAAIFFILLFVVIIIAFNIFGSLSMLIIEKKEDIRTLECLGAERKTIRRIFVLEGWLISLLGLGAGLVMGLALAFLQMKTGFVSMPGNYLVSAYPVVIKWTDIALTCIGVALTGYVIANLPPGTSGPRQEGA